MEGWKWRDPAAVMERKQTGAPPRTCAGCVQIKIVKDPFGGRNVLRCGKGKEVGQRCGEYQERTQ
jgi:hypothetical protein